LSTRSQRRRRRCRSRVHAVVTDVADAIGVPVGLVGVGDERAVVGLVAVAVPVAVEAAEPGQESTRVAESIPVAVG